MSIPSVVNHSCESESGFGPTLPPIQEFLEDSPIDSCQPCPIEPAVDCGPSPRMPWGGSQKSVGTSSYGEHSSGQFKHTTGMASGPPTPSDASFRTSIRAASLSNGVAQDTGFFIPRAPKQFFGVGRVFAVVQRAHASINSTGILSSSRYGMRCEDSDVVENGVFVFIVVQPQETHAWCLPVNSHQGQGLTAPGLPRGAKKSHAIVHDENIRPYNLPNEPRMRKSPIGVSLQDGRDLINRGSRVDFAVIRKVYFKTWLRNVGQVNRASLAYLRSYAIDALRTRAGIAS